MLKHFIAVFLIVAAVVSAAAQANTGSKGHSSPSLKLTTRTDRHVYRMSEEITMEVQLLNTGTQDVYVWDWDLCWNPARGFSIYVTAKDGSPVSSDVLFDCLPPPPQPGNVYQFIKLQPDEFHGTVATFKVKDLINKPGEFDIEVTFNSFISGGFVQKYLAGDPIAKLPVWTMEQPTITAAPVHVVIRPAGPPKAKTRSLSKVIGAKGGSNPHGFTRQILS
jgi:hypothetical protein